MDYEHLRCSTAKGLQVWSWSVLLVGSPLGASCNNYFYFMRLECKFLANASKSSHRGVKMALYNIKVRS